MKTNKIKTFREQILSMTAGEIIMSMVKSLEKPATDIIDMSTYGYSVGKTCYGCAATNTICKIAKVKFTSENIDYRFSRSKTIKSSEKFLELFEDAINSLRKGNINSYNLNASKGKFRRIQNPTGLNLPYLTNWFDEYDLKVYKQLAKAQRK